VLRQFSRGTVCPDENRLSAARLLFCLEGAPGEETRLLEGDGAALVGVAGGLVADPDGAGVGLVESAELAEQRRFTAPARPEHGHDLAGGDVEVHPVQHRPVEPSSHTAQGQRQSAGGGRRGGGHVPTVGRGGRCCRGRCNGAQQWWPGWSLPRAALSDSVGRRGSSRVSGSAMLFELPRSGQHQEVGCSATDFSGCGAAW
jgi:hypothetical protein